MTKINKQPTTEAGRSMVEMLGVLAVIGVLSIGGIAGYTHAMNKSKANDILDGVSKRAVVVSQQLIMGNETPSLVEYAGKKIGDCGVELKREGYPTDQFAIEVSGIEQGVCERLQDRGISNAVKVELGGVGFAEATCSEGEGNVLTYVFNDALDPNKVSAGGDPCVDVECSEGLTCSNGECKCSDGSLPCGTECCSEGNYCVTNSDYSGNSCAAPTTGKCASNADCAEGKFCDMSGGNCYTMSAGYCVDKYTLKEHTLNLPNGDLKVYEARKMSWYSASNLCKSYGLQMVTMADLGISDPQPNMKSCTTNYSRAGRYEELCICSGGDTDCSQTLAAIQTALGTGTTDMWLADNSTYNVCNARIFELYYGTVTMEKRHDTYQFVLCR